MLRIFIGALLVASSIAQTQQCTGLAFSGAYARPAYQSGVLKGLADSLPIYQRSYDIVTGVNSGSFNALVLSRFPKGNEGEAATFLNDFWTQFKTQQFYVEWPGGFNEGNTWQTGLYDSSTMADTIKNKLLPNNQFSRLLVVGSTDLKTGRFVTFNSTLTEDKILLGVKASASYHGTFPVVEYNNATLVDGTIKFAADLISIVNYCRDQGFEDNKIIVDTILDTELELEKVDASHFNTMQSQNRFNQIMGYYNAEKSLLNARHYFPEVSFRYAIKPSKSIGDPSAMYPYDYDADEIAEMIQLGEADAKDAVNSSNKYRPTF